MPEETRQNLSAARHCRSRDWPFSSVMLVMMTLTNIMAKESGPEGETETEKTLSGPGLATADDCDETLDGGGEVCRVGLRETWKLREIPGSVGIFRL